MARVHERVSFALWIATASLLLLLGKASVESATLESNASAVLWLPATATWYGSAEGDGSDGGACGYGNLVDVKPFRARVGAVSPVLFENGEGCGACFKVKCLDQTICSRRAVTIIVTDECPGGYCAGGRTHFDLSGAAFGRMAVAGEGGQLRNRGAIPVIYRRHDLCFKCCASQREGRNLGSTFCYKFPHSPVLFQSIANGILANLQLLKMAGVGVPKRKEQFKALMEKKFPETNSSTTTTIMNRTLYHSLDDTDHFIYELKTVSESNKIPLSAIFDQLSPSGDSFLHIAASKQRTEIVELIAYNFHHLLTKKNIVGDTPLHLATRSRGLATMKILLSYGRHHALPLTKMENCSGNVPLHEAVMIDFKDGVQCLFSEDTSASHCLNKERESPLYVAARNRYTECLKILLEAPVDDRMLSEMPRGNSPLHAAITTSAEDIGEEVMKRNKKFFESTDEDGSNPLHWAVSIHGGNRNESKKIRNLIRKTNPKCELQWDKDGDLPIHKACKLGKVKMVEELLKSLDWLDPLTLLSREGRNILHAAAEYGQVRVIWFIMNRAKNLINSKDSEGNTPLHIATLYQNPMAVYNLLWTGEADFNLKNHQGLTAVDLVFYASAVPLTTRQVITHIVLGCVNAQVRPDIYSGWRKRWFEPKTNVIKENLNLLLIIATVIATVTFAAGFTLPGGSIQSGQTDAGQPVFMNETMFGFFVSVNAIALQCSIGSVLLTLLCSIVPDKYLGGTATTIIVLLLAVAVFLMSCAFMASLSLVTKKSRGPRTFLVVLESLFLGCVFSPLIAAIPFHPSRGYIRYLHYYVIIRVMMSISGGFTRLNLEKKTTTTQGSRDSEPA